MYSTDRVTIETPEQIALEFPLAGVGSRFLALALDTLLQGALYLLVILLLAGVAKLNWVPKVSATWAPAVTILFFFCIYWGYFAAFEILWHGQTPGKRAAGIRVVKDSGRPISVIEGIGRNLMRAIDGLFFYAVGLITMMISRQNRRLGDYVAGTIVVREKKSEEIKPGWTTSNPGQAALGTGEYTQLSDEDLVIIETYLHRRWDLDPLVRLNTAIRICQRVREKTGITPEAAQTDDDFLEMVARKIRDEARFRPGSTS